jgi:two-component system, cell cycle response regulator DivK
MNKKILVVEDNEQNMYLVTFILKNAGYEVLQAYNGMDGVSAGEQYLPDLILLDIQLPKMDGYVVARILRKNAALAKTPIIAITSYAMPGDREHALAAGCTGYIEKPINPETFITQVEAYFKAEK